MVTDVSSEGRLIQAAFAEHLQAALGWESIYTFNAETFGPNGLLGRASERRWCWRATCARRWRRSTRRSRRRRASRRSRR